MKKYLALSLLVSSLSVFACQPEAQVIVHIKDIIKKADSCSATIELKGTDMWNMSFLCPLDYDLASSVVIDNLSCDLKAGDRISGILVQKDDNTFILE